MRTSLQKVGHLTDFNNLFVGLTGAPYLNSTLRPSAAGGEADRRRRRTRRGGGRGGGQGETPDWIRDLFVLVRRGNLDKLVSRLLDGYDVKGVHKGCC